CRQLLRVYRGRRQDLDRTRRLSEAARHPARLRGRSGDGFLRRLDGNGRSQAGIRDLRDRGCLPRHRYPGFAGEILGSDESGGRPAHPVGRSRHGLTRPGLTHGPLQRGGMRQIGAMSAPHAIDGFRFYPGFLDAAQQRALLDAVLDVQNAAPPYHAAMPKSVQRMSVAMTNAGRFGWYSDRDGGYRYIRHHPETGRPWPAIPDEALAVWQTVTAYAAPPDCSRITRHRCSAWPGLHQGRHGQDFHAPVAANPLGGTAVFRLGGATRKGPTRSLRLSSGDVCVLGGPARMAFHGVARV